MPVKEKRIKSFDGNRIFYRIAKGKCPYLCFLHGIGGNWTEWKREISYFEGRGYGTLAMDLRGHGLSDIPKNEAGFFFGNFAEDVSRVINTEKLRNFNLVGHSLGGAVAIDYCATKRPLPRQLVLVETTARYPYRRYHELNMNPLINWIGRSIASHEHFKEFKKKAGKSELDISKFATPLLSGLALTINALLYIPLKCIFACLDYAMDYEKKSGKTVYSKLKKLNIPTLIIAGEKDKTVLLKYSRELHNLIKNSQLEIIDNVSHRLPIKEPALLSLEIERFLGRERL